MYGAGLDPGPLKQKSYKTLLGQQTERRPWIR